MKIEDSITSVVGEYVALRQEGNNFSGVCPFCSEPGLSVSPMKQIYHCFNCWSGGNAVGFKKEIKRAGADPLSTKVLRSELVIGLALQAMDSYGKLEGIDIPDSICMKTSDFAKVVWALADGTERAVKRAIQITKSNPKATEDDICYITTATVNKEMPAMAYHRNIRLTIAPEILPNHLL